MQKRFFQFTLLVMILILGSTGCIKEKEKALVQMPFQENLENYYIKFYREKDPNFQLKKLTVIDTVKVPQIYVDSLKRNLYRASIEKLENNNKLREAQIIKLDQKISRYDSQKQEKKAENARNGIDKFKRRIAIEENKIQELLKQDSTLDSIMKKADYSDEYYFQVTFYMDALFNGFVIADTSSMIMNKDKQVESLVPEIGEN